MISVIIPIYNSEKYLHQCINSVLEQDLEDIEVLLINDGSTDTSAEICNDFAIKDPRVKVFHKTNSGVSSSRNLGIEKASKEWIAFVDSDDIVSKNYFNELHINQNSDFIFTQLKSYQNGVIRSILDFTPKKLNLEEFLINYPLNPYFSGPCGKFYKTKIIKANGIKFNTKMNRGEDSLFNLHYIFKCTKITLTNSSSYYYRQESRNLSISKLNLEEEEYYFQQIISVFNQQKLDIKYKIPSMKVPLSRYFNKLLNSELSSKIKINKLQKLSQDYKKELHSALQNQRVFRLPINLFIKLNLFQVLIKLNNLNK
ncbi:glycosyltransferase family 2 protein [Weeksellaceae bacterium KMM 9713]|uniref:Glycosyltransferase family 2 protein n=1 Tax=Profundicola chukchiensis TaxID=2961959 RepID=A0A9X4RTN9_9FLAO|nr:glycosyltransferase family A protein [Profundicola chukchiensis]MDG4944791.1 glycosyltransferase family 2 protein [Profundicola chukchiensis]